MAPQHSQDPDPDPQALSALLLTLADAQTARLTVEQIIAHFGARAFGAVLFIFAVPNLLPLPPGSSTVLGLPLLLISPQLMLGAKDPWIPRAIGDRTVDAAAIGAACRRMSPWVRRVERLTTPRLKFMFGIPGDMVVGLVCTVLAAVLILPIPLGNLLPAAAVAILGLSLTQRDGVLALLGYLAAGISVAVLALSGRLVIAAVARLGSMTGLW